MRCFALVLLGLYLVFVARLTLADPSAGQSVFSLADSLATRYSGGELDWSETEVLANVALFVPIGFLLTVVLGRPVMSIVLCVLGSACIELAQQQWLPSRVPTIADVQHNSLGGLIGSLVAWPLLWLSRPLKQPKVA
ncbi:VanZ family protein [Nocardioides marmoriginsengisoli]|uniref:VanZ family protein n=1 Tax=Nocardioides marmoriginsengisoli TaxID=661483 RepID=A0A3N0CQQ7_9ACTN|nr:VanZ family protein [Nocardioides marmoriginsengisoli]RNL65720.1 VanZ family protein [Nocardioides marmoriginsengisoli]